MTGSYPKTAVTAMPAKYHRFFEEEGGQMRVIQSIRDLIHFQKGDLCDKPPFSGLDLILCRQWGLSATLPAEAATQPSLLKEITSRFALAAPVIEFLNRPIVASDR